MSERRGEDAIEDAARTLIGFIRMAEIIEGLQSTGTELTIEVELTGGARETWTITIKRAAN